MKKSLIISVALMISSVTCFATVPADHPKLADYFAKRFVSIDYLGAEYRVDFKEVQSIVFDKHGHQSHKYAPVNKGTWAKYHYWMFFKNGTWLIFDTAAGAHTAWDTYQSFLKQNPQFLSVP